MSYKVDAEVLENQNAVINQPKGFELDEVFEHFDNYQEDYSVKIQNLLLNTGFLEMVSEYVLTRYKLKEPKEEMDGYHFINCLLPTKTTYGGKDIVNLLDYIGIEKDYQSLHDYDQGVTITCLENEVQALKSQMDALIETLAEERKGPIKDIAPQISRKKPFEETLLGMPISQYMVNQKTGEFTFMRNWKNATEVEEVLGISKHAIKEQFHTRPDNGTTSGGNFHWKKGHYTQEG